jgi:2-oxoglutarate dehydrogenase E2 component (dihydrolipoamide succinyltransferase)
MAESISEGTLSSFSKQPGDHVERDEEIASIETDKVTRPIQYFVASMLTHASKIDVSVNAPQAGTIKEFLVSEGDTVTVGQDIAKLETGEGGSGGKQEASTPAKEPASSEQPTTSDPEPKKDEKPKPEEPKKEAPPPPKEEKKPPPPPSEEKATSKKDEKKLEPSPFGAGSRGENRVMHASSTRNHEHLLTLTR